MSINKVDLTCRDADLFCPFCGKQIWDPEHPDALKPCEHHLFNFGQGQFFRIHPRIVKALNYLYIVQDESFDDVNIDEVTLKKILVVCDEIYKNFILFSKDMVGDCGLIGVAEFHIKDGEKSSSLMECLYEKPMDEYEKFLEESLNESK